MKKPETLFLIDYTADPPRVRVLVGRPCGTQALRSNATPPAWRPKRRSWRRL